MFSFRPQTCDCNVYYDVVDCNEYNLPQGFDCNDVIIDVGAHIGSFTFACLKRNAGFVRSFEADSENFRIACENLREYSGRVSLHPEAVWRSDLGPTILCFSGYKDAGFEVNTGGGEVLFHTAYGSVANLPYVRGVPLDSILRDYSSVRLLKLDCEGSEWPILLTSSELWRVNAICGEYHEIATARNPHAIPEIARVSGYDTYSEQVLANFLSKLFSKVSVRRHGDSNLGLFWASK